MSARTALVFPGQGSQRVGMMGVLPDTDDLSRLLDAAEALSGMPLRSIDAHGPDEKLADTRVAQPLLFLADWSWGMALLDGGLEPEAVAGHSLGEFAALAIAGVFSPEAGLELVVERSRLMAEVAAGAPGGMIAVLGLDGPAVAAAIDGIEGVWTANDNSPGQVVVSGTPDGLTAAEVALEASGARRVVPLAVSGAFHSPMMRAASDAFAEVLANAHFVDAFIPVVQNTLPELTTDAETIRARLGAQMTSPVRWTETMKAMAAAGIDTLIEAGPGAVLTGLARRMDGISGTSVEQTGIEKTLTEVL